MSAETYTLAVTIPSADTFGEKYSAYKNFIQGDGSFLVDIVLTPEAFVKAMVVTEELGYPAVSGFGNAIREAAKQRGMWGEGTSGYLKQCAGALTCVLMEANGYQKTGKKRSIPLDGWTKGEIYAKG